MHQAVARSRLVAVAIRRHPFEGYQIVARSEGVGERSNQRDSHTRATAGVHRRWFDGSPGTAANVGLRRRASDDWRSGIAEHYNVEGAGVRVAQAVINRAS